jgi:RNase P subunit RPR2
MKKISKKDAGKKIDSFFFNIKDKTPKDIKKIKRLAMSSNIPLKEKRKLFCKKCLNPYKKSKIRIKKGFKRMTCENCGYVGGWRIRTS